MISETNEMNYEKEEACEGQNKFKADAKNLSYRKTMS